MLETMQRHEVGSLSRVRGRGEGVSVANALEFDVQSQRQLAVLAPSPAFGRLSLGGRGEKVLRLEVSLS